MIKTAQEEFWLGHFGKEYTDRNSNSDESWDNFYLETWGTTKIQMNQDCLKDIPRESSILEVGCNIGLQLRGLQRMGFSNLYGIELQWYAVEKSKEIIQNVNIVQGSGFELPFKDNCFDIVLTNGTLIHIDPDNLHRIMGEMIRCSKRYISGFEYYSPTPTPVNYRGHDNCLWKADYSKIFLEKFPELELIREEKYPYINAPIEDAMYLLEKKGVLS